jgi:group I intron endonuclease
MIGIYKITSPNDLVYIGQSINILKRFNQYKNPSKSQKLLHASIKKYGYDNHLFEVLEICNIIELNKKERYWQDFYGVLNNGLNCVLTKTNEKSGYLSNETKLLISNSKKGRPSNWLNIEERNLKISNSLKGKKLSESHKKSLSIAQTGLKRSKEAIEKSVKSRKGLRLSESHKYSISKSQKLGGNSFAKTILNLEAGIFYDTAKQAAESIGMTYNSFNHYINGRTKRKLPFIYV